MPLQALQRPGTAPHPPPLSQGTTRPCSPLFTTPAQHTVPHALSGLTTGCPSSTCCCTTPRQHREMPHRLLDLSTAAFAALAGTSLFFLSCPPAKGQPWAQCGSVRRLHTATTAASPSPQGAEKMPGRHGRDGGTATILPQLKSHRTLLRAPRQIPTATAQHPGPPSPSSMGGQPLTHQLLSPPLALCCWGPHAPGVGSGAAHGNQRQHCGWWHGGAAPHSPGTPSAARPGR